jgi:hypothetical protein
MEVHENGFLSTFLFTLNASTEKADEKRGESLKRLEE